MLYLNSSQLERELEKKRKELEEQNMDINAELSGIGVVISSQDGKIKVEDVIEHIMNQVHIMINNHHASILF